MSTSGAWNGSIYLADSTNNRIRQLIPTSTPVVVAPLVIVNAVNAASLTPGPIAPGMLMVLLGTGLTVDDVAQSQVLFNTISAPILSVSPSQVLIRVPVALAGVQSVTITLNRGGVQVAQILANVVEAAPCPIWKHQRTSLRAEPGWVAQQLFEPSLPDEYYYVVWDREKA